MKVFNYQDRSCIGLLWQGKNALNLSLYFEKYLDFDVCSDVQRASEMARKLRIPRIYLSANSGARLGLAEEIKHLFRVAWEDPSNPDKVMNPSLGTIQVSVILEASFLRVFKVILT